MLSAYIPSHLTVAGDEIIIIWRANDNDPRDFKNKSVAAAHCTLELAACDMRVSHNEIYKLHIGFSSGDIMLFYVGGGATSAHRLCDLVDFVSLFSLFNKQCGIGGIGL